MIKTLLTTTLFFALVMIAPLSASAAINAASIRESSGGGVVTTVPMPTQTPGSAGVNSQSLFVRTTGRTGNWDLQAKVTTSFTDGSVTIPDSQIYGVGASEVNLSAWTTLRSGISSDDSPSFYIRTKPGSSIPPGDYTGTITLKAVNISPAEESTIQLSGTIHVLGYITMVNIYNITADVQSGESPGNVSSFNFPTQTAAGGVWSDNFRVTVSTNGIWDSYMELVTPFKKLNEAGVIKPSNTFRLDAPAGAANFGSGVILPIDNNISGSQTGPFRIRSLASSGLEAGDYAGEFTITVSLD